MNALDVIRARIRDWRHERSNAHEGCGQYVLAIATAMDAAA